MKPYYLFSALILTLSIIGCASSEIQAAPKIALESESNLDSANDLKEKGWSHLLSILVREGVDKKLAENALGSRDMPEREMLTFNLNPQEKPSLYKGVNTPVRRKHALEFYYQYKDSFTAARKNYGVPEGLVLAILQVETSCGQYTGNKSVFPAIARLANAMDPEILKENINNNLKSKEAAVYKRALYLKDMFVPHLVATFKIAPNGDVHRLRGSFAGAMGIPQFMPDNILKYGVDANQDGSVDIYNPVDAIYSTANYLKMHGWESRSLTKVEKRKVIWEYNRSTPYIDTVLSMADQLQKVITPSKQVLENVDTKKSPRKPSRSPKKLYPGARRAH